MRAIVPLARLAGRLVPGELGRKLRRGVPSIWARAGALMRADPILLRKGLRLSRMDRAGTSRYGQSTTAQCRNIFRPGPKPAISEVCDG
jgi:hypothetical protein